MRLGSFTPAQPGNTVSIAATTSPATVALPSGGESVLVFNSAASVAFVRVDGSTATATAGDVPIPAGSRILLACGPLASVAAAVLASGTGNIYFTRGDGATY